MAALSPPADQAADLLKNLSLDSQTKALEVPEPTKKPSVDSGDSVNGQIQPSDRSITPLIPDFMDPSVAYFPNGYASPAYYYGGYDGSTNDWDEYSRYLNPDGVDMSHGVYGDNGSLMYGYGYAPYGPYSPAGSPVPADGHLYGAQHYQYPTPYFQPMTPPPPATGPPYSTASKGEISTSAATGQAPLSVDPGSANSNTVVNGAGVKGTSGSPVVRPNMYLGSTFGTNGSFGFDGSRSPIPWLDTSVYSDGQPRNNQISSGNGRNHNIGLQSHLMSPRPISASGYVNQMYPNGQFNGPYRSGYGFGSNGRGWMVVDTKYKPRGRGGGFFYPNENGDGLNELNRGPRGKNVKNPKVSTLSTNTDPVNKSNVVPDSVNKSTLGPDRELFNRPDFPETYSDAKFFVIKSYSEDDVHKSIKYNVWASTQNGNKKLDAAYNDAKQKPGDCPVFLFFSVNTSGQFVGVAEMVGPVDFDKSVEYWQQDKWLGCFPVKWHIVKDLPNGLLKHIVLENNEGKPVTNSRDTQEVKLEQGLQVLKIFKEHSSKQCILDDFDFYEERQKRIQEKKAKQQLYQKQAWEGKPAATDANTKESTIAAVVPPNPTDLTPESVKEAALPVKINQEPKLSEPTSVSKLGESQKPAETVGEVSKPAVANGVVANGC